MTQARQAELEALSFRAWPAFEVEHVGSWVLRFADGYSRRLNSVTPGHDSVASLDDRLDECRRWFADRDQHLVVRLTTGMERIDRGLAERGFILESPVDIMTKELPADLASDGTVSLTVSPGEAWFEFHRPLLGDDRRHLLAPWRRILAGVEVPVAFALLDVAGRSVAAGFAVAEAGWVGLFQIAVPPDDRRCGYGRAVSTALLAWGQTEGAPRSYLQVERANGPGRALYSSLGFAREYGYWYRRSPQ